MTHKGEGGKGQGGVSPQLNGEYELKSYNFQESHALLENVLILPTSALRNKLINGFPGFIKMFKYLF